LGAKVVAGIFTALCLLDIFKQVILLTYGITTYDLIITVISVVVITCLWYGLTKERKNFVIPFLVYMGAIIVIFCASTAIMVVLHFIAQSKNQQAYSDLMRSMSGRQSAFSDFMPSINGRQPAYSDSMPKNDNNLLVVKLMIRLSVEIFVMFVTIMVLLISLNVWVFRIVLRAYNYIEHKCFTQNGMTNVYVPVSQHQKIALK